MKNADVYAASRKLLGDRLQDVVLGLMVGGGAEATASGIYYAKGCVPHNCGGNDAFMGIDPANRKVYFARQGTRVSSHGRPRRPGRRISAR